MERLNWAQAFVTTLHRAILENGGGASLRYRSAFAQPVGFGRIRAHRSEVWKPQAYRKIGKGAPNAKRMTRVG